MNRPIHDCLKHTAVVFTSLMFLHVATILTTNLPPLFARKESHRFVIWSFRDDAPATKVTDVAAIIQLFQSADIPFEHQDPDSLFLDSLPTNHLRTYAR